MLKTRDLEIEDMPPLRFLKAMIVHRMKKTGTTTDANYVGLLFISLDTKIGKANVQKLLAFAKGATHVIVIVTHKPSSHAIAIVNAITTMAVEIIESSNITFVKPKSRLVPAYTILNEYEIREVEKQHRLTRDKLCPMQATDAMAVYLGFRVGQVVKACDSRGVCDYRIVVAC